MKTLNKTEIVSYILQYDLNPIMEELKTLEKENRITAGCAYFVYNPYDIYPVRKIMDIVNKAGKSKDYFRYIKRTSLYTLQYLLKEFNTEIQKINNFIEEQKSLPFESTQKQLLKGEEGEE